LAHETAQTSEIQAQTSFHRHSFPQVHKHLLARTTELTMHGMPRSRRSGCDLCADFLNPDRQAVCTCEQFDWDICARYFEHCDITSEQRQQKEGKEFMEQKRREEEEVRGKPKKGFAGLLRISLRLIYLGLQMRTRRWMPMVTNTSYGALTGTATMAGTRAIRCLIRNLIPVGERSRRPTTRPATFSSGRVLGAWSLARCRMKMEVMNAVSAKTW
jgi:hypothetical protein